MLLYQASGAQQASSSHETSAILTENEGPGFRVLKIKVRFFVAALLRMTES